MLKQAQKLREQGHAQVRHDVVDVIEAGGRKTGVSRAAVDDARSRAALAKYDLEQQGDPSRIRARSVPPGWRPRKGTVVERLIRRGMLEEEYGYALEKAVEHAEAAYGGQSKGLVGSYDERIDHGSGGEDGGGRDVVWAQPGDTLAQASFRMMMMSSMNLSHQETMARLIRDYYTQAAKARLDPADLGREYIPYKQRGQQIAVGVGRIKSALEFALEFYGIPKPKVKARGELAPAGKSGTKS